MKSIWVFFKITKGERRTQPPLSHKSRKKQQAIITTIIAIPFLVDGENIDDSSESGVVG